MQARPTGPRSIRFTFNTQDRELPLILGQLPVLPIGAGLGEGVTTKPAALLWQRAAEHPVILVEPTSCLDSQVAAVVADLAAGADGLGLGRLDLLARLGEELLRVEIAAGGLVQPRLSAAFGRQLGEWLPTDVVLQRAEGLALCFHGLPTGPLLGVTDR